MIDIKINKELDYEMYDNFHEFRVAGVDFGANIKMHHPEIKLENYREYIDKFYADNKEALNKSCEEINQLISQKQKAFFQVLSGLFKMDFSDFDYTGYISIFDCNPRFVESKTFQVFYNRDLLKKLEVIFHEIMHFAFFDYCDKYLSEEIKDLDKNSGKLWELSEIFNVIALNLPEFRALTEREEKLYYIGLATKLEDIKQVWIKSNGDIKNFIKESLSI
jgi:hypothetical protein